MTERNTHLLRKEVLSRFNRTVTCAAALCLLSGAAVHADVQSKPVQGKAEPGILFSTLLPDLPGKRLVAANLEFDP
ncbi:MAG: hypothetical protein JWO52_4477, partial [Gammaproteobacteria bacterium]|nr:hypothetical protein [Gammaproteobacteria bacterium]